MSQPTLNIYNLKKVKFSILTLVPFMLLYFNLKYIFILGIIYRILNITCVHSHKTILLKHL